jgi:prepilin-type N-terminal cleavage/methylation domain-containing protein
MPPQTGLVRASQRGFSLLELLVVVFILVLAFLVFATFLGPGATGPSIERSARGIRSLVTGIRQSSSTRKVHAELVVDYKHDQVVALARRRLVTFSFDGGGTATVGSGNTVGSMGGGALIQDSRRYLLMDGAALELPGPQSNFTIPWMETFDTRGDYTGIAVSFDWFPLGSNTSSVVAMGSVFTIRVVEARPNSVRLALDCGGATAESETWLSLYRWASVEIACSRYGVSLYVDGRVSEGTIPDGFSVADAAGTDVRLGGVPCRIDNFEMNSLVSSQTLQLADVQLVAPGVSAKLESTGEAEGIYDWKAAPPKPNSPVTGNSPVGTAPAPVTGLPLAPVPAIVHVYFDASGKLDPARHPGAMEICLIAVDDGEIVRMVITIHPLGAVTWDYVDLFSWEVPPPPLPGGGS